MRFSNERIGEFINRWHEAFGEHLSQDDAQLVAGRVMHLYRQLFRPLPAHDIGDVSRATHPDDPPQPANVSRDGVASSRP